MLKDAQTMYLSVFTIFSATVFLGWLFSASVNHVKNKPFSRIFIILTFGFSIQVFTIGVLALLGLFNFFAISTSFVLLSLIGLLRLYLTNGFKNSFYVDRKTVIAGVSLAASFMALVLVSLRAPGVWDDTSFHLPIAKFLVQNGHLTFFEFLRYPSVPLLGDSWLAFGLLFGGTIGAQVLATVPLLLVIFGLLSICEIRQSNFIIGVAGFALIFASSGFAFYVGLAYVDFFLMSFAFAGCVLAYHASQFPSFSRESAYLFGISLGIVASTKYLGLVIAVLTLVLFSHHFSKFNVRPLIAFLAVATPWYLRNLLISGSIFHPLWANSTDTNGWTGDDLAANLAEQLSLVRFTNFIEFIKFSTADSPLLLLVIPAIILLFKVRGIFRSLLFYEIIFFGYWVVTGQIDRYGFILLGLGSMIFVILSSEFKNKNLTYRKFIVWGVSGLTVALCVFPVVRSIESNIANFDSELINRTGFRTAQFVNGIAGSSDRILTLRLENANYFFNSQVRGDWFGPARYSLFFQGNSVSSLKLSSYALKHHIGLVVVNENEDEFKFSTEATNLCLVDSVEKNIRIYSVSGEGICEK